MAKIKRQDAVDYSASLGSDPKLVQGAGGNVSWKDGDTLWIKASGTWLSQACDKEIFVPLLWSAAKKQAENGTGDYVSCVIGESTLRPSIETALHALLPQPVVVHCHAIDVIAHSVMQCGKDNLDNLLRGINWAWVDYVKPGPDLATAVASKLQNAAVPPDVIVLANHGLVVAGAGVEVVDALLKAVLQRTAIKVDEEILKPVDAETASEWKQAGYEVSCNALVQQLAMREDLLQHARRNWVLYPDHAVFLGDAAVVFESNITPQAFVAEYAKPPVCVIVPGVDVMISDLANNGQRAMIQCYADVVHRLAGKTEIVGLNREQIAELLQWDAEKYRQQLNEKQLNEAEWKKK